MSRRALVWFRRDLRIHDQPTLVRAAQECQILYPVYCFEIPTKKRCGQVRWTFLLECLADLNNSLKSHYNSRLLVARGLAPAILPVLFQQWRITDLYIDKSSEPHARRRDEEIIRLAEKVGVTVTVTGPRSLYDPQVICDKNNGKAPLTMGSFLKVISSLPPPPKPIEKPTSLPPLGDIPLAIGSTTEKISQFANISGPNKDFGVPEITEVGFKSTFEGQGSPHRGGETEALSRLERYCADKKKVAFFEKPKTSPAAFRPADTTVLSPYVLYGALSTRLFYYKIQQIYDTTKNHSKPPVSLHGQLFWKEFYICAGYWCQNYEKMEGSAICLQIPWLLKDDAEHDPQDPSAAEKLKAWAEARTGHPWIDAIMTQLRNEGWIHHLARHSVACFLTRGDLWISWERGAEVFEELLIDADWSLNVGNWLWLSASAFFHQYFRVYSPVGWGKKWDPNGTYVRQYVPILKKFPKEYIYEPWKAPLSVQKACGCIIGKDYPKPIVNHDEVSKINKTRMAAAYAAAKLNKSSQDGTHQDEDSSDEVKPKTPKKRKISTSNPNTKTIDNYFVTNGNKRRK